MEEEKLGTLFDLIIKNETRKTIGMVLERLDIYIRKAKEEGRESLTFKEIEMAKENMKSVIAEQLRNIRDFIKTGKVIFKIANPKNGEKDGK